MQIVLIEDNADHCELILETLKECYGTHLSIRQFECLQPALTYIHHYSVDLILSDLNLPDSPVQDTVSALQELKDAPAIVVLTSLRDDNLAQALVKAGVQDFLPKDELSPNQLSRACNHAIERRNMTRALMDKSEDYRAFCYSLTHDFKSSLWQISRYTQIFGKALEKSGLDTSKLPMECLTKVYDNVASVNKLVEDLQDYLSLEVAPGQFHRVSLRAAANNAADMLGETIDTRNAVVNIGELPEINGNLAHLQLLFGNLISNGIKYNESETPQVDIYAENANDQHIWLLVRDNGIGINPAHLSKIFTPFERLHSKDQYPGTGLGLSIVKRIVQAHEGRMLVSSTEGEGTVFSLMFPLPDTRSSPSE